MAGGLWEAQVFHGYKVIAYCVGEERLTVILVIFLAVDALKGLVSFLGFVPRCSSKEMVHRLPWFKVG